MVKVKPVDVKHFSSLNLVWWSGILATLLGLVWLSWPYAIAAYYLAQGRRHLDRSEVEPAVDALTTALAFEPTNPLAYRLLAKTYLAADRPEQALAAAQQAQALASDDLMVQLVLGDVYDRSGQIEPAIAHYEAGLVGDRHPRLMANYLRQAERLWTNGDQAQAAAIWQDKVRDFDYVSLYANGRLARYYAADPNAARHYENGVRHFPLAGVAAPPDCRLDEYQAQAFMDAVAGGLWTRETLLNVVAYRTWQDQSQATERLLHLLLNQRPNDADLRFYLGELYQRRGDPGQAETAYRQVLDLDRTYAPAYFRLGMVAEMRCQAPACADRQEALAWYEQYHKLAPTDPVGLRKLAEVATALDRPEAASWQAELEAQTDGRYSVAEITGLPVEQVKLGPNLVENSRFETWSGISPTGWRYGTYLGQPDSTGGLYIAGEDTLAGDEARPARIITLWGGTLPDGTITYAEYVGPDVSVGPTKYLVSLTYRSWGFTEGSGFIFWGDYTRPDGLILLHNELPATQGQWRVSHFLVAGPAEAARITPLVRNWGVGQLEILALTIRPVGDEQ